MYRAVPIQTPVKSGRELAWWRHIGIALHAVGNMIGVFLMHTRQCERCKAIGRDVGGSIRSRDRQKTKQCDKYYGGSFHCFSKDTSETGCKLVGHFDLC